MLDALCAPPVPPGRDIKVSEDVYMDLDAPSSKRSRDTSSSAQPPAFMDPSEFAQSAQTASVPLPRTLAQFKFTFCTMPRLWHSYMPDRDATSLYRKFLEASVSFVARWRGHVNRCSRQ